MSRDETATEESKAHASDSETSIEPDGAKGATSVHWLARVAERAGLEGKRPDIAPETETKEAWPAVTRAYKIEDSRLCELVATYFRL